MQTLDGDRFLAQTRTQVLPILLLSVLVLSCTAQPIDISTQVTDTPVDLNNQIDRPLAANTFQQYVGAINNRQYSVAYSLLTKASTDSLGSVDDLELVYESARSIATAQSVTYTLRGGVLETQDRAVSLLVSTWQTSLLGSFTTTATITASYEAPAWTIAWERDLVVPGMNLGRLSMTRFPTQRGGIYTADNNPIVIQTEHTVIGVSPGLIGDAAEESDMLSLLSQLTGMNPIEIQKRYANAPANWFVPIATVDEDELIAFSSQIEQYHAISAQKDTSREYTQGDFAPHVIGYTGPIPADVLKEYRERGLTGDEYIGLSGVEGYWNDTLGGLPGGHLQTTSSDGGAFSVMRKAATNGRDVTLSISPTIQIAAQQLLGKRRGAVVVMRPNDGAVLAISSYPTFDSSVMSALTQSPDRNTVLTNPDRPLLNRVTQGAYPPGSTFKMVTVLAGIREGVTTPDDIYNDPGYWDGLGRQYRKTCWLLSGHGRISLKDGLTASCDVVFYIVGKLLDDISPNLLPQYGTQFGYGFATGIDLIGEVTGLMPDPSWKQTATGDVWTPGDTVNLSIGQGFMLATPLQVAQMTAAIANGGTLYRPRVVTAIGSTTDQPMIPIEPVSIGKVEFPSDSLQVIRTSMEGVTTNRRIGTTTHRFSDFNYYIIDGKVVSGDRLTREQRDSATTFVVAGKSGTAQAPGKDDLPFAWFTAYAPASDPEIVVTVLLENVGEGSTHAAPLVRQIIESYFGLPISKAPVTSQPTD